MSDIKIRIEAEDLKELLHEFADTLEEMGSIVLRGHGEIPETLEPYLKTHGYFLYQKTEQPSEDLIKTLLEEHLDDLLENIFTNENHKQRLLEILGEKGFTFSKEKSDWD